MTEMILSVAEPFTSPAWGSNFVVFSSLMGDMIQEQQAKEYISKCCKYAKSYQVYLVPERFLLMGYQCMCLISPEGKVLGAQKSVFWNLLHKAIGKRTTALDIFSTEFGGIFLCVDVDIYRPEIARVACDMGAQYIICSQQIARGDYGTHMVLSGCWNAAQSNRLFVIDACNQFNCLCAPCPLTVRKDGFVVSPNLKTPMTAKINAADLKQCAPRYHLSRKFYAVHRDELTR